ncbi:MAG: hypothetical protein VR65_00325 [Desulfobulbaceae bacterium BRH_c16a]|nr:MAG: hypothetical protein VR65_00325 [Desulfobulbaceae bacterium BRH_c16a]
MSGNTELTLSPADYDKAFTEVSFLLDMFIETIVAFVGKSTPSLAVAAGRKMAANLPVHMVEKTPEAALGELVRVLKIQQMDIEGRFVGAEAVLELNGCPIGSVCRNRKMEIGSQVCQMFHYYIAGIMAELSGCPARPKTLATGDNCTFSLAFSGVRPQP